jgi:hypothetical protein
VKKILQLNFKFKVTRPELEKHWLHSAPKFGPTGEVKGLLWKIWLMNEAEKTAGGIYLFEDEASVEAYLKGPILAAASKCPLCSAYDIEVKVFDILLEHTKITRGPVG